jgi:hypothetical protein
MNKDNNESVQIAVEKARLCYKNTNCLKVFNDDVDVINVDAFRDLKDLYEKALKLQADRIKELKEKVEWIADIHNNLLPKYDKLEKEKTELSELISKITNADKSIDKIKIKYGLVELDNVKKVILNWHKDYTDTIQIEELIKEIDKLKGV